MMTEQATSTPELLTEREAAAILGVKSQTLAVWRSTRRYSLRWHKIGHLVRYRRDELVRFIAEREVSPLEIVAENQTAPHVNLHL